MKPIEVGFDGSFKIDNNLVNCFLIPSSSMDLKGGGLSYPIYQDWFLW